MSLLSALRAYVGLGPDEEYDEWAIVDGNRVDIDLTTDDGTTRGLAEAARAAQKSGQGRRSSRSRDFAREFDRDLEDDDDYSIDTDHDYFSVAETPSRSTGGRVSTNRNRSTRTSSQFASTADPDSTRSSRADFFADDERDDENVDGLVGEARDEFEEQDELDDDREFVEDEQSLQHEQSNAETDFEDSDSGAVVRSLDSARFRPKTLAPTSFGDAKTVADEFKYGVPVTLNLQDVDRDLARRLIDFASGICYALDGSMEKVAPQVFLLIPEDCVISDSDRRRIEQRGYAR